MSELIRMLEVIAIFAQFAVMCAVVVPIFMLLWRFLWWCNGAIDRLLTKKWGAKNDE